MPAVNLALFKLSLLIRLTRAGTREAVLQDYVKFARAKGLGRARVIGVHVLKNILIPIVTVIGLELGSVIAFAIVTESIFAWPGTGKLLIDSINQLDRPVIVAYLLVIVTIFIAINFVVDVLYSVLDPRVRLRRRGGALMHVARRHRQPARAMPAERAWSSRRGGASPRSSPRAGSRSPASRCSRSSSCGASPPRRLAAEPLRPRAARRHRFQAAAGRAPSRDRQALSGSAPTTRAATCSRGSSTACASRSSWASRARCIALAIGLAIGLAAAYFGGWVGRGHHAHRRHPALVSRDPHRPGPARGAGAGRGQDHRRAGDRAVGVLRAHGARRPRWSSGRRNTSRPRRCWRSRARASSFRPPAAQLPAAAHRRRHRAGRARDPARGRRSRSWAWACRSRSRRSGC